MLNHPIKHIAVSITMWITAAFIMLAGLFTLTDAVLPSLAMILAGLAIVPPIYKLYTKKLTIRIRYIFPTAVIIFFIAILLVPTTQESFERSIARSIPEKSTTSAEAPTANLSYSCGSLVTKININGEDLERNEREDFCNNKYEVALEDGENTYEIEFSNGEFSYTEELTISFDLETYEIAQAERKIEEERLALEEKERVAQEEKEKQEEEEAERIANEDKEEQEEEVTDIIAKEEEPEPAPDKTTIGERNALKSATSYLNYSAFSYSGLVEQLEYEDYSNEEAVYAVKNCGADWNEQAASSAQSYIDYSAFSRSGLIEQLEYEGFTHQQAEYGVKAVGY